MTSMAVRTPQATWAAATTGALASCAQLDYHLTTDEIRQHWRTAAGRLPRDPAALPELAATTWTGTSSQHGHPLSLTPLHLAVAAADVPLVHELLQAGADVRASARTTDWNCGGRPLHLALWFDAGTETLAALLHAGADPNDRADTYSRTHPLDYHHHTCSDDRVVAAMRALLHYGADPTPLLYDEHPRQAALQMAWPLAWSDAEQDPGLRQRMLDVVTPLLTHGGHGAAWAAQRLADIRSWPCG